MSAVLGTLNINSFYPVMCQNLFQSGKQCRPYSESGPKSATFVQSFLSQYSG